MLWIRGADDIDILVVICVCRVVVDVVVGNSCVSGGVCRLWGVVGECGVRRCEV